jgi:uncharacterized protein (DUF1778 family)
METKLDERIVVMVSSEQKRLIHEKAAAAGMGIGEWIRDMLVPEAGQGTPAMQQRMANLEQRIAELEALMGKGN